RLRPRPHHAHRPAPLRGRRHRGRYRRADHLHAYRRRRRCAGGDHRRPSPDRLRLRPALPPLLAAPLPGQGEECAGRARGDPPEPHRRPPETRGFLDSDQARLYELIWQRMMASQMESAELERTTADITAKANGRIIELRATGTVIKFDGFLTLYNEDLDDPIED